MSTSWKCLKYFEIYWNILKPYEILTEFDGTWLKYIEIISRFPGPRPRTEGPWPEIYQKACHPNPRSHVCSLTLQVESALKSGSLPAASTCASMWPTTPAVNHGKLVMGTRQWLKRLGLGLGNSKWWPGLARHNSRIDADSLSWAPPYAWVIHNHHGSKFRRKNHRQHDQTRHFHS